LDVRDTLTPEQIQKLDKMKEKFRGLMHNRMEKMGKMGKMPPPPPDALDDMEEDPPSD
jgi:hypothetical protein